MLQILLIAILIYTNAQIAKKKGKNPVVWGLITFVAFFLAFILVFLVYLGGIYKGVMQPEAVTLYLNSQPLTAMMLSVLSLGGALIVRYILEKSPGGSDTAG